MSRIALIFLLVLAGLGGYGQQEYFVLIQSDNNQPFYVRMGEQTLTSTPQGHLILSQLKDSVYHITISFPKKLFPERDFYVVIDKKDLGFQLKYLEEKGWALFNTQTLELEIPSRSDTITVKMPLEGVRKDNAFSRLMAGVVSDTAVMYNTSAMETYLKDSSTALTRDAEARKADPSLRKGDSVFHKTDSSLHKTDSAIGKADSSLRKADFAAQTPDSVLYKTDSILHKTDSTLCKVDFAAQKPDSILPKPDRLTRNTDIAPRGSKPHKTELIVKLSEQKTRTVLRLAYADHVKGHRTDTIEVLIPVDTPLISPGMAGSGKDSVKSSPNDPGRMDSIAKKRKDKPVVINSDCRNFASDEDVDKLRSKLLAIATDEGKISAAKKVFKLKCFSTSQLKSLSDLFTPEETKYRFLETAYPFVSDDRFRELSGLFRDPVYLSKFKTMTGGN